MDPDTAFSQMLSAFAEGEFHIATDAAYAVLNWLRAGGFPPKVNIAGGGELLELSHEQSNRAVAFAVANEVLAKSNRALLSQ